VGHQGGHALRICVTGSTGLIGRSLCDVLAGEGHQVIRLRRDASDFGPNDVLCNQDGEIEDAGLLEDLDAIVHLAGEPILGFRWTAKKKNRIWESRVGNTKWLVRVISRLQKPPRVLVSSSAVGYYGDNGDKILSESYFQHADHFKRILKEQEVNRIVKKTDEPVKELNDNKKTFDNKPNNLEKKQESEKKLI